MYIPPGTYQISKTIYMNTDTILMGDATNVSLPVPAMHFMYLVTDAYTSATYHQSRFRLLWGPNSHLR